MLDIILSLRRTQANRLVRQRILDGDPSKRSQLAISHITTPCFRNFGQRFETQSSDHGDLFVVLRLVAFTWPRLRSLLRSSPCIV